MRALGDQTLLRIFAKHEPYETGHLGVVTAQMRELGAPEIRVIEWRGDFYAVEGSHRLAAAHYLGLIPAVVIIEQDRVDAEVEEFWERIKDTLPHYAWLISSS